MLTIIVAARNDDYGAHFRQRFFRSVEHNAALFAAAGIPFEYLLAEWNPLGDRPLLSEEFVHRVPQGRTIVIPPEVHALYGLNSAMPFHEMAAKNAALRRANGENVLITNADILFSHDLVRFIAEHTLDPRTLYRAHRIDVDPSLSWMDIQDPENQLPSGEGLQPPPYYLGAGGDFCLAHRSLWHYLRGFNERIRFSTRAKDWQFFLSAAAKGIGIEFIGNIYHLDHGEGFRNTPACQRQSASVHFGGWWDIEFGLPVFNSDDWGFYPLNSHNSETDPRIQIIESQTYTIPPERDQMDRHLRDWLTFPPDAPDTLSTLLLHALYAAYKNNRRLICRFHDIRQCVVLSGLRSVAERFSVKVFCDFVWPSIPGFSIPAFCKEPKPLNHDDYIIDEFQGSFRLREDASLRELDVFPRNNKIGYPQYNPLLVKRLLFAFLLMRREGINKIAIFGTGRHTEELLSWGLPDDLEVVALLKSSNGTEVIFGKQVRPVHSIPSLDLDAVLLSSSSFEPEMKNVAQKNGAARVIPLYMEWPSNIWKQTESN